MEYYFTIKRTKLYYQCPSKQLELFVLIELSQRGKVAKWREAELEAWQGTVRTAPLRYTLHLVILFQLPVAFPQLFHLSAAGSCRICVLQSGVGREGRAVCIDACCSWAQYTSTPAWFSQKFSKSLVEIKTTDHNPIFSHGAHFRLPNLPPYSEVLYLFFFSHPQLFSDSLNDAFSSPHSPHITLS